MSSFVLGYGVLEGFGWLGKLLAFDKSGAFDEEMYEDSVHIDSVQSRSVVCVGIQGCGLL